MSNAWPRRSSSICAPCSTNTVYARPSFVTMCGTPGHERGPRPNFRRNSDTYRRLRETHGEIALADEDRARRARSPSRPRPRASRSQPLLRLGGAPAAPALSSAWRRIRLQLSEAPPGRFTSVPEAPRDRGNPDLLWRPFRCHDWRDRHLLAARGTGYRRTPLIYLLMAVSARRLSTATVGEVNVHWRSVAKWM
jgi:hypothetical protein